MTAEQGGSTAPLSLTTTVADASPTVVVAHAGGSKYDVDEHLLSIDQLAKRYPSSCIDVERPNNSKGLSTEESAALLAKNGPNVLVGAKEQSEVIKFLSHFTDVLILMLLLAAALAFLAYGLTINDDSNIVIAGVVCVMVVLICSIGYYQERAASNIMASIKNMMPATTRVVRSGIDSPQQSQSLVVGDIVHLTIGNRVPADIRLILTYDLKVEMSQMTGEPDALEMTPECKSVEVLRSRNVVFNGSLIMSGSGYGCVVRTGNNTMLGRIAGLASSAGYAAPSTLQTEIHRVAVLVAVVSLAFGLTCFIIALARGEGIIRAFSIGFIFVIIAAVPEGLPPAVTTVLTLTSRRLAERCVLVKRTDIPEVLSAVTALMTDKTGTLTQGKMYVSGFWSSRGYVSGDSASVQRAASGRSLAFLPRQETAEPENYELFNQLSIGLNMTQLGDGSYVVHHQNILPHPSLRAVEGMSYGPVHEVVAPLEEYGAVAEEAGRLAGVARPPTGDGTGHTRQQRSATEGAYPISASPSTRALAIQNDRSESARIRRTQSAELGLLETPVSERQALAQLTWTQQRRRRAFRTAAAAVFEDQQFPPRPDEAGATAHAARAGGERLACPPLSPIAESPAASPFPGSGIVTTAAAAGPHAAMQQPRHPDAADVQAAVTAAAPPTQVRALSAPPEVGVATSPLLPLLPTPVQFLSPPRSVLPASSSTTVDAGAVALPIASTKAKPVGGAPSAGLPLPGAPRMPPPSGAAIAGEKEGVIVTFQSFHEMQHLVWDNSTGFTRMVIAMAVNNKATRLVADKAPSAEEEGSGGMPPPAASEPPAAACPPSTTPGVVSTFLSQAHLLQSWFTNGKLAVPAKAVPPRGGDTLQGAAAAVAESTTWLGDASDTALARYADELMPLDHLRGAFNVVAELPFNSTQKVAITVVQLPGDLSSGAHDKAESGPPAGMPAPPSSTSAYVMLLKGAPERVIDRCTKYVYLSKELPMDDEFLARWRGAYERFGMTGQRVLGVAYTRVPQQSDPGAYSGDALLAAARDMVFLGLVALRDPPKPGVRDAVLACKSAGIRVLMVTGDHQLTAEAIARDVGIITQPTTREISHADGVDAVDLADERVGAAVISGDQLPHMSESDWDTLLTKKELVFARTSPEQKLQIVKQLQRLEHVVAVTGDGTNDAPALKAAQIGIAMGGPGASDAAREAAALVLLDNDFTNIVHAIVEGRTLFVNLRKLCVYWLSHAPAQLWSVFITITLLTPLPLTGLLILTVDLVQEQVVAMSFAFEPTEESVMQRPPRKLGRDTLIDYKSVLYSYVIAGTLETLTCVWAWMTIFLYHGVPGHVVLESFNTYWTAGSPDLVVGFTVLTAAEQVTIAAEARSAYYLTLIGCQFFNLWNCKTQTTSIFKHLPRSVRENHVTFYGVGVMVVATSIVIYVPAINTFFGTADLVGWGWVFCLAFGVIITAYNEWSKWQVRHNPGGFWAKRVQW